MYRTIPHTVPNCLIVVFSTAALRNLTSEAWALLHVDRTWMPLLCVCSQWCKRYSSNMSILEPNMWTEQQASHSPYVVLLAHGHVISTDNYIQYTCRRNHDKFALYMNNKLTCIVHVYM
jgi:hypothetical protein